MSIRTIECGVGFDRLVLLNRRDPAENGVDLYHFRDLLMSNSSITKYVSIGIRKHVCVEIDI